MRLDAAYTRRIQHAVSAAIIRESTEEGGQTRLLAQEITVALISIAAENLIISGMVTPEEFEDYADAMKAYLLEQLAVAAASEAEAPSDVIRAIRTQE